jgi:vacuolar-type H+-ATPase catalytic subunit A/Vma1
VTQGTLSTVKDFLGLSANRAYKRFYPVVWVVQREAFDYLLWTEAEAE